MAAEQLELKIYTYTGDAPDTYSDDELLFNAKNLTWSNIADIWDECVSFYNGHRFRILRGTTEETCGKVLDSALGTFQYNAEQEPYNYSGFIYTDRGVSQAIVVENNATEDDIKKAILKDMVENLFEYLKINVIITDTRTSGDSEAKVSLAGGANQTFENVKTSATTISGKNANIALTWELSNKSDTDKVIDVFNIRPRQFGTPNPYNIT